MSAKPIPPVTTEHPVRSVALAVAMGYAISWVNALVATLVRDPPRTRRRNSRRRPTLLALAWAPGLTIVFAFLSLRAFKRLRV